MLFFCFPIQNFSNSMKGLKHLLQSPLLLFTKHDITTRSNFKQVTILANTKTSCLKGAQGSWRMARSCLSEWPKTARDIISVKQETT